jgi:hypothetical protein
VPLELNSPTIDAVDAVGECIDSAGYIDWGKVKAEAFAGDLAASDAVAKIAATNRKFDAGIAILPQSSDFASRFRGAGKFPDFWLFIPQALLT